MIDQKTHQARCAPHLLALTLIVSLAGCAVPPGGPPTASPAPPITAIPYSDAVLKAANGLFAKAASPLTGSGTAVRKMLVIDPLIDGATAVQSTATQSMEARIVDLVKAKYPQFDVQPFTASNVAKSPLVFIGTFTPVNQQGNTAGVREAFRICLALLDIKSGKIVSKAREFAQPEGVNITPTKFFKDSPTWAPDPATEGYIKTCQGTKPGDPINPLYWDRIMAAGLINEAIDAYDNGRYQQSLELYQQARRSVGGDQLRVLNGLYLTNWNLGRRGEAAQAFAQLVDFGLTNNRLGVKFLFRPGSTELVGNRQVAGQYPMWLGQIAQRTAQRQGCLEVVGHTSRTGPEPINERLSLLRAQQIKQRLEADAPTLSSRTIASGMGSRETLVGIGTDDARDALDRRVEFKVLDCATPK
ncbi:OmpA family protein [uncultured Lamprocystis sp.]|jgi:outer membrane protein OmpA-like peptidoglycan-associated protein|uniref:OmpA family protein n=1 Tax=uncultured Lamprocystis sp. TaxID=543132 RepID=UPI0025FA95C3|nr:OmpA family protein [uncultured Lamprocystis sp.]